MDPVTIATLIGAAVSMVPNIAQMFKRKPSNIWMEWSWDKRIKYVEEGLLIATTAILTGKAMIIDDVMKPLIAKVDVGEDYPKWLRLNKYYIIPLINRANEELAQAKKILATGGKLDGLYFRYISPKMIYNVKAQDTGNGPGMADIFSGNSLLIILIVATVGFAYSKLTAHEAIPTITKKQLKS